MMKKYIIILFLCSFFGTYSQENIKLLVKVTNRKVSSLNNEVNYSHTYFDGICAFDKTKDELEQYHMITIDKQQLPLLVKHSVYSSFLELDPMGGLLDGWCSIVYDIELGLESKDKFYDIRPSIKKVTYGSSFDNNGVNVAYGCQSMPEYYIMTPTISGSLEANSCGYMLIPDVYFVETTTPRTSGLVNKLEYKKSPGDNWDNDFIPKVYEPYGDGKKYFKISDLTIGSNYSGTFIYRVKIVNTKYLYNKATIDSDYIYTDPIITEIKSCSPKVLSQTPEANKCYGESLG
ncbi:hypothetical protein, partial [Flavobacterium oreochromis]|uniref:hypothetical protein n=1 Tax=Flavobacterium oreochromis TaxID=2906078 RepID=UPI00385D91AD